MFIRRLRYYKGGIQMADSWEKDIPEHQQRTFEEIKKLNAASEKMLPHPDTTPVCASPNLTKRQTAITAYEARYKQGIGGSGAIID